MTTVEQLKTRICKVARDRLEILTAYLFGSVLTVENPGDIDIAVLIDDKLVNKKKYPYGYEADLSSHVMDALRKDQVDVVILNRASPIISMQVLRKGEKVFERSPRATNDFFVRTISLYFDLKRVRRPIERSVLNGRIYA